MTTTLPSPYIAVTDKKWFDYLASIAVAGRVDEVNFWSPLSVRPMKRMHPGEPVFFRLKAPIDSVAGYGFFAHFTALDLTAAWQMFGERNGQIDETRFRAHIGTYRGVDLSNRFTSAAPIGCTILLNAMFWPRERWIPWKQENGWKRNIVQGRTEDDVARASRLLSYIDFDHVVAPEELQPAFKLVEVDNRQIVAAQTVRRERQGAFRSRLLDAYGRRCAITGERTEPVLDAAHVQPYLGPRSNHIQNGVLLAKEFHALFDLGFITITPQHVVRVSSKIRENWSNGRRYYAFHEQRLAQVPAKTNEQPSAAALDWHNRHVFVA